MEGVKHLKDLHTSFRPRNKTHWSDRCYTCEHPPCAHCGAKHDGKQALREDHPSVHGKKFAKQWEDVTCYVSEPLFVPKPGSAEETDGVLVFTCLNPDQTNPWTSLVVLSHDLDEIGRVKFQGVASPASFHGAWMSHT